MSQELGKEKGVFGHFKGSIYDKPEGPAFRNSSRITIAPTGTISMIADCSSGIEPLFAISFVKRVMDGQELLYVNEDFKKIAMQRGFYSEELMEKIAQKGTIAHFEEIPENVRKVFVSAHDISPEWHLKMQAAWQKYTDNAISKTVNFTHDATVDDVKEVYMLAYKLGCKGVTIYRDGSKGFENQVLNLNVEGKSSKEIEENYKEKMIGSEEEKKKNTCPKCKSKMHMQEGCATCMNCGYSVCSV
jgi:ribonucleoside-diphosphate reductase alpha chain